MSSLPVYAEAALPVPLRQTFTYLIPSGLRALIRPGARVLVPFGNRQVTGYAVAFHDELDPELGLEPDAVKEIIELLDEEPLITPEILELTRWTADYYLASWGEVLKASLPAGINQATERVVSATTAGRNAVGGMRQGTISRDVLTYILENGEVPQPELENEFGVDRTRRALRTLSRDLFISFAQRKKAAAVKPKLRKAVELIDEISGEKLTEQQQAVVNELTKSGGVMLFTDLLEKAGVGASPVNTLAKRGVVAVVQQEVFRDPFAELPSGEASQIALNEDQTSVLEKIVAGIDKRKFSAFLLHGVTGSGKTEVYIRAMQHTLQQGRSALMLVPEIALTPLFSRRLRAVFGDSVAILHSELSAGERFDEWRNIYSGRARVVIGTRSAVFAPLREIGLVIVDEEHDPSYRQHEMPFYHARDIAVMRANLASAAAILGSATPALESFQNARSGKYLYLRLSERIGRRPLARTEIVDMREVFRAAGKDVTISPHLAEAIAETHAKGEQSIILLNRRGFSQFVLCRSCGETLRCRNCDITMTYHRGKQRLMCHYCTHSAPVPDACPFCESEFLHFVGEGTEQLESILEGRFPDLTIARVDRDSMSRKGVLTRTLTAFDEGRIDMLAGTQMLAKGHDFHNVTLVGVISVDNGLGMPDFRAAERTFQLLTQVAGRAGRGELAGRVIIQTYYPEHYAIRHAANQDFDAFFAEELKFRERFSYPPFVILALISIKHTDLRYAHEQANLMRSALEKANNDTAGRIYGVAPASLARLRGEYRLQILIKAGSRKKLRALIDQAVSDAENAGCDLRTVSVEIDPVNVL